LCFFWGGRQFFYFVFGLLLLDFNYIAFGEATLCYRMLHAFGMDNAVGFFDFGEAIHLNLFFLLNRILVGQNTSFWVKQRGNVLLFYCLGVYSHILTNFMKKILQI
jgi:hypothetical protein